MIGTSDFTKGILFDKVGRGGLFVIITHKNNLNYQRLILNEESEEDLKQRKEQPPSTKNEKPKEQPPSTKEEKLKTSKSDESNNQTSKFDKSSSQINR